MELVDADASFVGDPHTLSQLFLTSGVHCSHHYSDCHHHYSSDDESDDSCDLDPATLIRVVAILGPQASGKSTLCNALFHTNFPIAPRGAVAVPTTRGIDAAVCSPKIIPASVLQNGLETVSASSPLKLQCDISKDGGIYPQSTCSRTVVLDVEGADARDRGRAGKAFQTRATTFVASIADTILLNLWFHDTTRVDSAGYGLLHTILATSARMLRENAAAGNHRRPKTCIIFVIRDIEDDYSHSALSDLLLKDAADMWADISLEAGLPPGSSSVEDLFDLHVLALPHIRHCAEEFSHSVSSFRSTLLKDFMLPQHSKLIPAEGFMVYACSLWDSLGFIIPSQSRSGTDINGSSALVDIDTNSGPAQSDFYAGDDLVIVAAYRCDEIFSELLAEASGEIGKLQDEVVAGGKIPNFGTVCEDLISETLQRYEREASEFACEEVFERKRRELEAILDTGLNAIFLRLVQRIRDEVVASFKTSIEGDEPEDYAIFTADTRFVSEAKKCQRPSSSLWTFDCERNDLQRILSETASQQRKLIRTQLVASQQQSQAMRYVQIQHSQMQHVRQQALGGISGQWNLGAAYRPPDSNVNISLAYEQGRTNVQVSMVPDESASLLGPMGFSNGVLPGNIGLSFSINM